jgi:ribonuclease T1
VARVRVRRPLLALIVLVVALVVGYSIRAATSHDSHSHTPSPGPTRTSEVSLSALPAQAAQTVRLIKTGGPFPYPRNDGVVFHNNEHELPSEGDGYYREYTVPTPGSADRGARRIITGRGGQYYYTGNHYDSFVRVDVSR